MSGTVTATASGTSAQEHIYLQVRVYTSAAESGGANAGSNNPGNTGTASGGICGGSITPNQTNSAIVWSISQDGVNATVGNLATNNTADYNNADADSWGTAQGHYTGTVTSGSAVSYGQSTNVTGTDHWNWCAYELIPSGGTPTVDASSPVGVKNVNANGLAVTTGAFTPPAGSVIVAQVCFGGNGLSGTVALTMSDTFSLSWTQRAVSSSGDDFQPCWIYTATMPGGGAPAIVPRAARRIPYRTQALPAQRRGRVTFPVPKQLNPPYPFSEIAQHRQTWPRAMPHRGHVIFVVPPQLNPPYPWAEISQHRDTWPKAWPRRGRIVTPVPPQLNPPYPFAEIRQNRDPRGFWPRRGRQVMPVPAQVNPPYLFAEIRQWRQPRGLWPRRGHQFTPVPAQQSATPNPAITFQQARHPRVLFQRRGHVFTPVPGQHHPVAAVAPKRVQPRGMPRRGRQAQPVPAQVVNPAWVQGHRAPARAIALIRRRWHDLFPWPQATAAPFSIGALTANDTGLAALRNTETAARLTAADGSLATLTARDQRQGGPS